ncbi:hypothetical protein TNCV_2485821 [Trichonephila clavipes]|uniref:Uncharacterized protein n=1 Tax=Trichonephila clavipes TaxID=2585209 RepID=A0A8X6VZI4_TRICX|nr:hypothetical protein TNCV_2485821 [Trichonephila clavipes]
MLDEKSGAITFPTGEERSRNRHEKRLEIRGRRRGSRETKNEDQDFPGEGKENERRWRCKSHPTHFIEICGSILREKQRGAVIEHPRIRD